MSIFNRDDDSSPSPAGRTPGEKAPRTMNPPERSNRGPTQIASGATVVGEVKGASDLVVEGEIEGKIDLESDVVVGQSGTVRGNVSARSVRIGGTVHGNVRGRERVEILATGRLEGDVVSPRMVLAEGAFFKGKVEMTGAKGSGSERKEGGS